MRVFDGRLRLPLIEALDLRRARPAEARPCADCDRLTRAGELCCRCQIVDHVARSLGWSRVDVWRALLLLRPPALACLLSGHDAERLAARLGVEG
jgi:hypothetical protein